MTNVKSLRDGLEFSDISEIEINRNFLKILKKCKIPPQLAKLPVPSKLKIVDSNGQKISGTWGSENRLYVKRTGFRFEEGMILTLKFLDDDSILITDIRK